MAETFDFPVRMEPSGQVLHRMLKAPFGDGYTQVAPDGINTRTESWNLSARGVWNVPEGGCAPPGQPVKAIAEFIDARGAEGANFIWTSPTGTTGYWRCDGYSIAKDTPAVVTLSFTFYQDFMP